jgi:hypothetical protein
LDAHEIEEELGLLGLPKHKAAQPQQQANSGAAKTLPPLAAAAAGNGAAKPPLQHLENLSRKLPQAPPTATASVGVTSQGQGSVGFMSWLQAVQSPWLPEFMKPSNISPAHSHQGIPEEKGRDPVLAAGGFTAGLHSNGMNGAAAGGAGQNNNNSSSSGSSSGNIGTKSVWVLGGRNTSGATVANAPQATAAAVPAPSDMGGRGSVNVGEAPAAAWSGKEGAAALSAVASHWITPWRSIQAYLDHHHGSYAQELEAAALLAMKRLAAQRQQERQQGGEQHQQHEHHR